MQTEAKWKDNGKVKKREREIERERERDS